MTASDKLEWWYCVCELLHQTSRNLLILFHFAKSKQIKIAEDESEYTISAFDYFTHKKNINYKYIPLTCLTFERKEDKMGEQREINKSSCDSVIWLWNHLLKSYLALRRDWESNATYNPSLLDQGADLLQVGKCNYQRLLCGATMAFVCQELKRI